MLTHRGFARVVALVVVLGLASCARAVVTESHEALLQTPDQPSNEEVGAGDTLRQRNLQDSTTALLGAMRTFPLSKQAAREQLLAAEKVVGNKIATDVKAEQKANDKLEAQDRAENDPYHQSQTTDTMTPEQKKELEVKAAKEAAAKAEKSVAEQDGKTKRMESYERWAVVYTKAAVELEKRVNDTAQEYAKLETKAIEANKLYEAETVEGPKRQKLSNDAYAASQKALKAKRIMYELERSLSQARNESSGATRLAKQHGLMIQEEREKVNETDRMITLDKSAANELFNTRKQNEYLTKQELEKLKALRDEKKIARVKAQKDQDAELEKQNQIAQDALNKIYKQQAQESAEKGALTGAAKQKAEQAARDTFSEAQSKVEFAKRDEATLKKVELRAEASGKAEAYAAEKAHEQDAKGARHIEESFKADMKVTIQNRIAGEAQSKDGARRVREQWFKAADNAKREQNRKRNGTLQELEFDTKFSNTQLKELKDAIQKARQAASDEQVIWQARMRKYVDGQIAAAQSRLNATKAQEQAEKGKVKDDAAAQRHREAGVKAEDANRLHHVLERNAADEAQRKKSLGDNERVEDKAKQDAKDQELAAKEADNKRAVQALQLEKNKDEEDAKEKERLRIEIVNDKLDYQERMTEKDISNEFARKSKERRAHEEKKKQKLYHRLLIQQTLEAARKNDMRTRLQELTVRKLEEQHSKISEEERQKIELAKMNSEGKQKVAETDSIYRRRVAEQQFKQKQAEAGEESAKSKAAAYTKAAVDRAKKRLELDNSAQEEHEKNAKAEKAHEEQQKEFEKETQLADEMARQSEKDAKAEEKIKIEENQKNTQALFQARVEERKKNEAVQKARDKINDDDSVRIMAREERSKVDAEKDHKLAEQVAADEAKEKHVQRLKSRAAVVLEIQHKSEFNAKRSTEMMAKADNRAQEEIDRKKQLESAERRKEAAEKRILSEHVAAMSEAHQKADENTQKDAAARSDQELEKEISKLPAPAAK